MNKGGLINSRIITRRLLAAWFGQIPKHWFALGYKAFTVRPNIFSTITAPFVTRQNTNMCISSNASIRNRQITLSFGGHSRVVGLQYGMCYMLHFWPLGYGDGY